MIKLIFYYDETNNIRKLRITEKGLNVDSPSVFVLGGVISTKAKCESEWESLKKIWKIQSNNSDIKLKHLIKGDIYSVLNSKKVGVFLQWLKDSEMLIHYICVDLFYFTVVDIIDSFVLNSPRVDIYLNFIPLLKDTLYELVLQNKEATLQVFFNYQYPDIEIPIVRKFTEDLYDTLFERNEYNQKTQEEHIGFYLLNALFKENINDNELVFLHNETGLTPIESFESFYTIRINKYKSHKHILDEELSFDREAFDDGVEIDNYEFCNSNTEYLIQASDIIVGILGKFFTEINSIKLNEISHFIEALNSNGKKTL